VVAVILAAVALFRHSRTRSARLSIAFIALLILAGWLFASQTVRFAFPLAALVAVLAAVGAAALPKPLKLATIVVSAVVVLHGIVLLGDFVFAKLQIQRMWTGEVTREEWRHRVTVNDPQPVYRAALATLEDPSKMLIVGEGRSWGCEVPHHLSSSYDLQQIQEWTEASSTAEELARRIASNGFSHLLINWGELQRLGGPGFRVLRWRNPSDEERWNDFLAEWTIPLLGRAPCELRALRPPYMGPNSHAQ
jgi:hypothetical protein